MVHIWKAPHIVKGMLTRVPALNAWRAHRASTGGTDSARYCYTVWLRHLANLHRHGFRVSGARVGELGPGDSLGAGLAALLSGAGYYVGLDLLPFFRNGDLRAMFDELVAMYAREEPIPADDEFPMVRPKMQSYRYPSDAAEQAGFDHRVTSIRRDLDVPVNSGSTLSYHAPWMSDHVARGSLDLVFSQSVLQYVEPLDAVYREIFHWLKPGGYSSHAIGLSATYLSPFWNGHWAYSDWEWRLARGRREYVLNREPLSRHLSCARDAGFSVLSAGKEYGQGGLASRQLSPRYRSLDAEDQRTRFVMLILQKPAVSGAAAT